ncbi:MAG: hypothetical protein JJ969_02495 [Rhizobiaceae bacterium]|nr:hypothetical protein [Rhizobiaceae bacterium]
MTDTEKKSKNLSEADFAQQKMGKNSLQGDDQGNVRNQRHAAPDVKKFTDGIVESFRKLDKDYRARKDLNKGARKTDD